MVFVSVSDAARRELPESTRQRLKDLGFGYDFHADGDGREKFIGIITDEGITEDIGSELRAYGYFRNRSTSWWMMNLGYEETGGTYCMVNIDGKEYPYDARGLSFVVYDTVTRKVVDTASF